MVRSIPSAMPCHAKREGLWRTDTMVFATYLPHLLVRFTPTLKSNHNYKPLDNERFNLRRAVTSLEARLDLKAGGFGSRGDTAFFDVRVTHVNSKSKKQEGEKKRKYQQRVLDYEIGSFIFTPLVFGTNGGMWTDCNCFLKHLAVKLSEKNEEHYHITITWIVIIYRFSQS